ncbi:MAG: hypothetical protein ACRDSJ_22910 [Rubrobacteraceae bacterium]
MAEEKKSFWARIFGGHQSSEREEKVLEYIVHRTGEGASLQEVVEEEYVKRNATRSQVDDILSDPRLVHSARERMKEAFESGELDPSKRPDR